MKRYQSLVEAGGGVQAWCRDNGSTLELILDGGSSRPIDIVVIHADCSMAHNAGFARPCPPASETAIALTGRIELEWLGLETRPDFLVIATPSQSSDAWVVATLDPPYANLAEIECDKSVETQLTISQWGEIKKLRFQNRVVKKPARSYLQFAARIAGNLDLVCARCHQAEAFRLNFQRAIERVLPPLAR